MTDDMTNDTNSDMTHDLDGFDRALLTELRHVAIEGAPAPVRRTRRRLAFAGTGVAALAATVVGVTTLGSSAAYAVSETGDGDIVITIHELKDASGLEDALAAHGIDAEVDYDNSGDGGMTVGGPDGSEGARLPDAAEAPGGGNVTKGEAHVEAEEGSGPGLDSSGPANDPCGGPDQMPFDTALTEDAYTITIPADSVLLDQDAALQITTTGDIADQLAGLAVAFSVGDVSCGFGTMSATSTGTAG